VSGADVPDNDAADFRASMHRSIERTIG